MRRAVLAALVAVGCSEGPPPVEAPVGDFRVRLEPASGRLSVIGPDGGLLLDGVPAGLAARRAEARYEMQLGSFKIEEEPLEPWRGGESFEEVRADEGAVRAAVPGVGELTVEAGGAGELVVTVRATATANRLRWAFACDAGEHFLGLGGQSFDVDHRGQNVPIWVQEDGITKSDGDRYGGDVWALEGRRHSTHTAIPITLSSRGYALLLDTVHRSVFDLCAEAEDRVSVEVWEPTLILRLFAAPTPKQTLERVGDRVGRPSLPPPFAFGPWIDALHGSDEVRATAARLRAEGIPASAIWAEDWRGGAWDEDAQYVLDEDWELDRALYPDFEALAAELHASGFKLLIYNNTFLTEGAPVFDEGLAGGHAIRDASGAPYTFIGVKLSATSMVDLTRPESVAWVKAKFGEGLALGADGWMADYGEWLPVDAALASGEPSLARHNLYPVDFQRLNRELLDEAFARDGVERLTFVRSAYLGSQPLVSVIWAGDQQTDFSEGDGMPSVIPIGLGLGVVGFPYYGHDIGGYMSLLTEPTSRELWFRWASLGAMTPVMRTHHGRSARDNWRWDRDAETIAHFRRWTRLHQRLFPYIYAAAEEAARTGTPIMRPVALDEPGFEPGWTRKDQYLLGDRLLVAPIVVEGATSREVELPPGDFRPLEGGAPVRGTLTASAPLEELPVFVRAGTVLVLLDEQVDTLVGELGEDRELWIYLGGDQDFTEVSGLTYRLRAAALATAPPVARWNGAEVPLVDGAVTVTGPGTLELDGGATLTLAGGSPGRRSLVRFR